MKNFSVLNKSGTLGVYEILSTDGIMRYAFLLYFTDMQMHCVSIGNKLYLDSKFSAHHADMVETVGHLIDVFKLKKIPLMEVKDYLSMGEPTALQPISTVKDFTPVKINLAEKYFADNGFDVSSFRNTLVSVFKERDYSSLIKGDPEASFYRDLVKDSLARRHIILDNKNPHHLTAKAIKNGKLSLVYLVGPAGTGKTTLAYQFSDFCEAPLLNFQGSEGVEKDELVGASDVNTDEGATTQFKVIIGPLLKAYSKGYQAVIDEANFIIPGVMSVVNSMTDDTPSIVFKGKTYLKHPNFVLYLTSNQGYEGTYLYNPATKTRGIVIEIPKLTHEVYAERLYKYTAGKLNIKFGTYLSKLGDKIQDFANKWGENSSICIRQAFSFSDLILSKPVSLEEFIYSFEISFVQGALNMDTNNSAKVNALLKSTEMLGELNKLYDLYDYRVPEEVDPVIVFSDFFSGLGAPTGTTIESITDDSDFEDSFDELFEE
jgi:hypothetical protein